VPDGPGHGGDAVAERLHRLYKVTGCAARAPDLIGDVELAVPIGVHLRYECSHPLGVAVRSAVIYRSHLRFPFIHGPPFLVGVGGSWCVCG
jgi:hypothetical protein